jgi:membrane-bound metal-dependent hydrolase YbcI (DUF457 family)
VIELSGRIEHQLLGAVVGISGYALYKKSVNEPIDVAEAIGSAIVGSAVALLPDSIEPATNSNHREFFHSESLFLLAVLGAKAISENSSLDMRQKHALLTGIAAYCGHLAQDSTTPAGLPFI